MRERRNSGGLRMGNYFPLPARYRVASSTGDEGEWGARLVGFFFIVMGLLNLARPLLGTLRVGTLLAFGAFGMPVLMNRRPGTVVLVAVGALFLITGFGIVLRRRWAHWLGIALALVLFVPALPYATAAGLLIAYLLWRGRPKAGSPSGAAAAS